MEDTDELSEIEDCYANFRVNSDLLELRNWSSATYGAIGGLCSRRLALGDDELSRARLMDCQRAIEGAREALLVAR